MKKDKGVYVLTLTLSELDMIQWVCGGLYANHEMKDEETLVGIIGKIREARKQCQHVWKTVGRGDMNSANTGHKSWKKVCKKCGLKLETDGEV